MDLKKIGAYIANKRKFLGMTQRQLADKLGMSDKSVSKWERGVCLPDVSIYMELCEILGISINEFLAGEDISEEDFARRSEDNLLRVTKYGKRIQKHQKEIIAFLTAILMIAVIALSAVGLHNLLKPQNVIGPANLGAAEQKMVYLLSDINKDSVFHYSMKDDFKRLKIYMREYRHGELVSKKALAGLDYEGYGKISGGLIAIVPNHNTGEIRVIVVDDEDTKFETKDEILKGEKGEDFGWSILPLEEEIPIQSGKEQALLLMALGKEITSTVSIELVEKGEINPVNDYVYYFSVEFEK